ncbi:MAG: UbiD family decarboxylase [Alphaproteobacteria bacterium]|jgi:4-hydroxy-3-polyprenylbenzoate decarboxylase|nr:UbiD family decarboxylase [Alphaproteobacteria bacterium]MDP6566518.1 UbiD family decarboxylase [Alphaproteobacteria bacterium]MDP6812798.1 UbiD family decarboxylase [Alphaproteobacteria bacterium]
MVPTTLRTFLDRLRRRGQLVRIDEPVSTALEMTEIHARLLAREGPAVLFENPVGPDGERHDIPVLMNLFGTVERVAMGLGCRPEGLRQIGETLAALRQPTPPGGLGELVQALPMLKQVGAMTPVRSRRAAPCQQVVLTGDQVNLARLPIARCWPGEPAPLIIWPLVVTKGPGGDPADGYNLGVYRMQVLGRNQVLMRWLSHRGGAQHYRRWKERHDKPMPVAAAIGADPATILAAVTPLPDNLSEYGFAGLLRGRRVPLVRCRTVPLEVPAEAEIVLEGHVSLDDHRDEGPYGDHTGHMNAVAPFPVFTISAITMRRKPIYLTTYTGHPPDEPAVMSMALNEVFVPIIQVQFPEIADFWLPPEACSYRIAVVSIRKAYPGHARRIMMGIWSHLRQFTYTKMVIVVDDDVDVRDWRQVMWAVSTRMDPVRDTMLVENTPIDYLDFASPEDGLGGKMGLDATVKVPPETGRQWGRRIQMDDEVVELVSRKWADYGLPGDGAPVWTKKR